MRGEEGEEAGLDDGEGGCYGGEGEGGDAGVAGREFSGEWEGRGRGRGRGVTV